MQPHLKREGVTPPQTLTFTLSFQRDLRISKAAWNTPGHESQLTKAGLFCKEFPLLSSSK